MTSIGRRTSGRLNYNPLNGDARDKADDKWVCVSTVGVPYYVRPSLDTKTDKEALPDAEISAVREGDWLKENGTGLYLPYRDANKEHRLFKNVRLLCLEQLAEGEGGEAPRRRVSTASVNSVNSMNSVASSNSLNALVRRASDMSRHSSSSNPEGKEKAKEYVKDEVSAWHCVRPGGVPYFTSASMDAPLAALPPCANGAVVHGVKEGPWLRVIDKQEKVDVMGSIGRRSLRAPAVKSEVMETGMYLPFLDDKGNRQFKNEKTVLWEMAQNGEAPPKRASSFGSNGKSPKGQDQCVIA